MGVWASCLCVSVMCVCLCWLRTCCVLESLTRKTLLKPPSATSRTTRKRRSYQQPPDTQVKVGIHTQEWELQHPFWWSDDMRPESRAIMASGHLIAIASPRLLPLVLLSIYLYICAPLMW